MRKKKNKKSSLTKIAEIVGIVAGVIAIIIGFKELPKLFNSDKKLTIERTVLNANFNALLEYKKYDTLRIEDEYNVSWSGVHNCDGKNRIEEEYRKSFNTWKSNMIKKLDTLLPVNSNFEGGEVTTNKSKSWDNKRKCSSTGKINCWIEFVRIND